MARGESAAELIEHLLHKTTLQRFGDIGPNTHLTRRYKLRIRQNEKKDKYILNLKKRQDNTSEKELSEMEIKGLLDNEFKAVIIKMHTKLGR